MAPPNNVSGPAPPTTARGFDSLRAEPNGFLFHHHGRSETVSWRFVRCLRVRPRRASPTHQMDGILPDHWLAHTPFEANHGAKGCAHNKVFGQICVVGTPALLAQRVWSHLGRLAARLVIVTPGLLNFSEASHTHLRVNQSTSRRLPKQGLAQCFCPHGPGDIIGTAFGQGVPKSRVNFSSRPSLW